jgi:hypothetical protein
MWQIIGVISTAVGLMLSALALIISLLALIASAYFYFRSARQLQKSTRLLQNSINVLVRYLELTTKDAKVKPIRNKEGDTTGFSITFPVEGGSYQVLGTDATLTKVEKEPLS